MSATPNSNRSGLSATTGFQLNSEAPSFSPRPIVHRQSLREDSFEDFHSPQASYGPIGRSSRHAIIEPGYAQTPMNNHYTYDEGNVYGSMASSSAGATSCEQCDMFQGHATSTSAVITNRVEISLDDILAAHPSQVFIAMERERGSANPHRPDFLHGLAFGRDWYRSVLPRVRRLSFVISSTTDLHYLAELLASSRLPHLYESITSMEFPGFYWFGGVGRNRLHNPYFQMTATLPNLQFLTIRLHTASVTESAFEEKEMVEIERSDPIAAKERKVMRLVDVLDRYEMNGLFACRSLRRVRLEFVESDMVAFFTKDGKPVDVLRALQMHLINGFTFNRMEVFVELVRIA